MDLVAPTPPGGVEDGETEPGSPRQERRQVPGQVEPVVVTRQVAILCIVKDKPESEVPCLCASLTPGNSYQ